MSSSNSATDLKALIDLLPGRLNAINTTPCSGSIQSRLLERSQRTTDMLQNEIDAECSFQATVQALSEVQCDTAVQYRKALDGVASASKLSILPILGSLNSRTAEHYLRQLSFAERDSLITEHADIAAAFSTNLASKGDPTVADLHGALARVVASEHNGWKTELYGSRFDCDARTDETEDCIDRVGLALKEWQQSVIDAGATWRSNPAVRECAVAIASSVEALDLETARMGRPLELPKVKSSTQNSSTRRPDWMSSWCLRLGARSRKGSPPPTSASDITGQYTRIEDS